MTNTVHIVSFDVPFPANYGGVIDVFHRIKALHQIGLKIHLHCFEYGRGKQTELEKFCEKVYYYPRKKNPFLLFSKLPFIVKSRENSELLNNLTHVEAPIIFEGHHTCSFLNHPNLANRVKLVRAHNIEYEYYIELAKSEKSVFKRWFFNLEGRKLRRFDNTLKHANSVLTVSLKEQGYYQNKLGNSTYLPVFNPLNFGHSQSNKETYSLFHGNLSVSENENACNYLIDNIFGKHTDLQFKIAGFRPSEALRDKTASFTNIELIDSPSNEDLQEIIKRAQINLLFTFQNTGIKHKLLNALSNGGHVIVNRDMIYGTGLENWCHEVNEPQELIQLINSLMNIEYSAEDFDAKIKWLKDHFDITKNALKIQELLSK